MFQANVTIGHLSHLAGDFYWPLRFGLGVAGGNLPSALFVQRLDLIGLAYNWSHFLFEAHLPSFRHGTDASAFSLFDWHFGLDASYVFAENGSTICKPS